MARKPQTDNTAMDRLKRELRDGPVGSLYIFHGEETYLREHYLRQLEHALVPPGLEAFDLHRLSGRDCSVQQLAHAVDCLPVMSERTLTIATDFDLFGGGAEAREQLAALLDDLPDYCCLVFVYDLLDYKPDKRQKLAQVLERRGQVVPFGRQGKGELVRWVARRFHALGHDIDPRLAEYLIARRGELMQELAMEIEKVGAYAPQRQISRQDIDAVVVPQVDAAVFQMTDAIAQGDFEQAAAVLSDLFGAQEAPIKLLSIVGDYFRKLYTARLFLDHGRSQAQLMSLWGLPDWRAKRLMGAARRYSLPWCRMAVRRCAETDLAMKSGGDERAQQDRLTGLLMELANAGRTAP